MQRKQHVSERVYLSKELRGLIIIRFLFREDKRYEKQVSLITLIKTKAGELIALQNRYYKLFNSENFIFSPFYVSLTENETL